MKFHALGLPHTITSREYNACAFTQKVLKWIEMMAPRGHEIIHYGHKDSTVQCDHVTVTNNDVLEEAYGGYDWKKEFFKHNVSDHAHQTFYRNTIDKMNQLKLVDPGDVILCFWGYGHRPVSDNFPQAFAVEPGIGYSKSSFAKYRCFESYAVMHYIYGLEDKCHGHHYDAVIPNYFNEDEFTFKEDKEDYILFLSRLIDSKGIHVAIQATEATGKKLVIAGQGNLKDLGYSTPPSHVEHVGYADVEKRADLMSKASAVILPTFYVEPFGGVVVEAMLSGTPVITSDWGVFNETVLHGQTGYRCRSFDQFCWAIENVRNIDPQTCRNWSMDNFTYGPIGDMYEEYFRTLAETAGDWYARSDRKSMNWLEKTYPATTKRIFEPDLLSQPDRLADALANSVFVSGQVNSRIQEQPAQCP